MEKRRIQVVSPQRRERERERKANDAIRGRKISREHFERRVSPVGNPGLGIGTPSLITAQNQARLLFDLAIGYRYPIAPLVFPPLMTSLVKDP
jgi:hypothetical protein